MSGHSKEGQADRLRQLSEEVSRVAATLARLAMDPDEAKLAPVQETGGGVTEVSLELVSSVIRARRRRERYFSKGLFADPAWDMMLDLLEAEILQRRVPVSSLCVAAAVPATTALRWLKTLVHDGLLIRCPDPVDLRRVYVELSPQTSAALRRYFTELRAHYNASP